MTEKEILGRARSATKTSRDHAPPHGFVAQQFFDITFAQSRRTPDWEGFVARCGLDCERGPERGAFDGAYAKCETGSAAKTCWHGASDGPWELRGPLGRPGKPLVR